MIAGALALLLGLGFADGERYRLMPTFSNNPRVGLLSSAEADEEGLRRTLSRFNGQLGLAYRTLDPSALASVPMDDGLRRSYVEELAFLRKDGRAMELSVADIGIEEVRRLPNELISVRTAESVSVRYLAAAGQAETFGYVMNYLLERSPAGWKVLRAETLKVEERRD